MVDFFLEWWYAGIFSIVLQIVAAVHVVRHHRNYYWLFLILMFPPLGAIIYLLAEWLPEARMPKTAERLGRDLMKAVAPNAQMKKRANELAICGSLDNKVKLANECLELGLFEDAQTLLVSARTGAFSQDPVVSWALARAYFYNQNYAEALKVLTDMQIHHPQHEGHAVALLMARAYQSLGQIEQANNAFLRIIPAFVGFEAKCRYGLFLIEQGQNEQAKALFSEVVQHAKRFPVRDTEKEWLKLAKRQL